MGNTKMAGHLISTIFFQFGRNIRQIRQICQLKRNFKKNSIVSYQGTVWDSFIVSNFNTVSKCVIS